MAGVIPFPGTLAEGYLRGRGIPPMFPLVSGVKYHPTWRADPAKRGRPAVVFPLRRQDRVLVAAQGRFLDDGKPRMMTLSRYDGSAKAGVFATPHALEQDTLTIVESPIDALSLAQCGCPALATCGAGHFPVWLPPLGRGKRVFIGFDPDTAGETGAQRLCDALAGVGTVPERLCPSVPGMDWNAYLQAYGGKAMGSALLRALLAVGDRVLDVDSRWRGRATAIHPPGPGRPDGWIEYMTDSGEVGQADARDVVDPIGRCLVWPQGDAGRFRAGGG